MKAKNMYRGIALMAVALATTACQNELKEDATNAPNPGEKVTMTIRATQGTAPQTRTSYEDKLGIADIDKIVVKWEGGSAADATVEKIKVFGYDSHGFSAPNELSSIPTSISDDGSTINFTGDVSEADKYLAAYPAENCTLSTTLPLIVFNFLNQTQDCSTGKEMAHLKGYDIMLGAPATPGTNNFTFTHAASMLRFILNLPKKESVTKVTLACNEEYAFSTYAYAMMDSSILPGSDTCSLSLDIKNHTASTSLKAYMMICPCGVNSSTLTITVDTESGSTYNGVLTTEADTRLEAGNCYTLAPTLTPNVITVPPVETPGNLGDALAEITPAPGQTELALTGEVNQDDIAALATFLKDPKAENITTIDLSGLSGVTEVKGFEGCEKIADITLPATAEAIGASAFKGCTALTTVTQAETAPQTRASMPKRVKIVGESAFENCTSMAEMFLHANITSVEAHAFKGCTALKALIFESKNGVDADLTLGTGIIADTHADLKILLPNITDVKVATTFKTALDKPTYYNFADYSSASTANKLNPEHYTIVPEKPAHNAGEYDGDGLLFPK